MVYDANGALIKSVAVTTGGNPTRTLYIGSVYEEEISSTSTDKPYTNYYSFGGQMVGMRKGNQPTSGDNRQLRVVGDHLGSTSLVIDTSSSPQVVHRQYYKPYGEIAYTTGSDQASINLYSGSYRTTTLIIYVEN